MSRLFATSQEPGLRLENIAARLRDHDWVEDARLVAPSPGVGGTRPTTVLLVPNAAGVRVLRLRGKGYLVSTWEGYLRCHGMESRDRIVWRLTEALPAVGQEATPEESLPEWMPVVSDLAVATDSRSLSCRILVPYDLAVFRGHFPSAPIVPGVMQVAWAAELARAHGLIEGRLAGIGAAKFRRLVRPGARLAARIVRGTRIGQVQFRYELNDAVVSTGCMRFEVGHD